MLVLLLLDALLSYVVALRYANRVGDSDLANDVRSLAQLLQTQHLNGTLSEQARFLLEYDPDGHNYFSIVSSRRGMLTRNGSFPGIAPPVGNAPVLFDSHLLRHPLRAAAMSIRSTANPNDALTVTVGETLHTRHERAKEILLLTIPMQALLIVSVLSLLWIGVTRGLRILDPLTRRLALREHELGPISDSDVPKEILPLTHTIDALFARLRQVLAAQERFLADAAHQLRTPLTGLRLHVERALDDPDPDTLRDALRHIQSLTRHATRTSVQLLAMTRVQSPLLEPSAHTPFDLDALMPETLAPRVYEAMRSNTDLGYQGPGHPAWVRGDPASLTELVSNLVDNALRYAGAGSRITVSVDDGAEDIVTLVVEDDGPGVPAELMSRLGERFFRVSSCSADGTGLGLAIVRQIARQHQARVRFENALPHGLRVTVSFPSTEKSL